MATPVGNQPTSKLNALIVVHNAARRDMLRMRNGLIFHADASTPVSLADITSGSSLPVQVAFVAALSAAYVAHIGSACSATTGQGAHISADATNVLATPPGTDLATCYARIDGIKAKFNLHGASAVFHPLADATNVIAATDATTAGTLATLGNQVKAVLGAHFAAAMGAQALQVVSA